jgi:hypothetical protein
MMRSIRIVTMITVLSLTGIVACNDDDGGSNGATNDDEGGSNGATGDCMEICEFANECIEDILGGDGGDVGIKDCDQVCANVEEAEDSFSEECLDLAGDLADCFTDLSCEETVDEENECDDLAQEFEDDCALIELEG